VSSRIHLVSFFVEWTGYKGPVGLYCNVITVINKPYHTHTHTFPLYNSALLAACLRPLPKKFPTAPTRAIARSLRLDLAFILSRLSL
jgi:hypothetical protein